MALANELLTRRTHAPSPNAPAFHETFTHGPSRIHPSYSAASLFLTAVVPVKAVANPQTSPLPHAGTRADKRPETCQSGGSGCRAERAAAQFHPASAANLISEILRNTRLFTVPGAYLDDAPGL